MSLDSVLQDVRYGLRSLGQSPGLTLAAVASLAFGLGVGLALFTFMNAVLFRPLPGRGTADLQKIFTSNSSGGLYGSTSFADFRDFTATPGVFAATCASARVSGNIALEGRTIAARGAVVSGGCFGAIGLRAHLGRLLGPGDEATDGGPVPIVISHALWRSRFSSDRTIAGRSVLLNGVTAAVVGVTEAGFAGLSLDEGAAFFAPARVAPSLMSPDALTSRGYRAFVVFARLADGVSPAQAMDRLSGLAERLRAEDPKTWTDQRGSTRRVTMAREIEARFVSGGGSTELALSFMAIIAGVVALACVNLATMLVARGAARTRELAIRLSLGASRMRLLRQLATESLLISIAGMIAGLLIVCAALTLFHAFRPPVIPAFNLGVDWRVAVFAAVLAVTAPVIFGVAPGAHALRLAIAESLKNRPPGGRVRFLKGGPREVLIFLQVAVSFALLIGATLFMQSLGSARPIVGPAAERLTILRVDLGAASQSDEDASELSRRLLVAAGRVPGVSVSIAGLIPMTGSNMTSEGRAAEAPQAESRSIDVNVVSPGYFELLGTPRLLGRDFVEGDAPQSPPVAIVSESMARELWQTTAVLGRSIWMSGRPREVVGVVADVPYRSASAKTQPLVYVPQSQLPRETFVIHARLAGSSEALAAVDRELRMVDPRIVISAPATLASAYDEVRLPGRIVEGTGGVAGLLQLALALMATWGLVAYAVERRSAEIALRRALGATDSRILRLVMRPSLWLFAAGGGVGSAAGVLLAQALHAEFLGLGPINVIVVIPAALLFGVVVVFAAWLPARRATSVQPATLLRHQ